MTHGLLEGANVQAQLIGSGEVSGEVTVKNIVEAGSELLRVYEGTTTLAAKVSGMWNANGVGSTGKSSPDAAAPSHVGSAGNSPL